MDFRGESVEKPWFSDDFGPPAATAGFSMAPLSPPTAQPPMSKQKPSARPK